ncbi:hypothetical protein ACSFBI_22165 [Variovorax sp. RB3P1]|jgi:hypothetical protein|uniref:hypothetical protein n=1 Tax=Variovorax sp. RB3P1 TaxID=3443732 RepID=UPI003F4606E9
MNVETVTARPGGIERLARDLPSFSATRLASGMQAVTHNVMTSRANLIRLLPLLASLRLYDNSAEGDPKAGRQPQPQLLLHMEGGRIVFLISLDRVPPWAKPIMAVALA